MANRLSKVAKPARDRNPFDAPLKYGPRAKAARAADRVSIFAKMTAQGIAWAKRKPW